MSGDAAAAEARIMEGLAREAAGLGVEIVDVAGNIEDVSARVAQQALSFTGLVASAGEVNDSNRRIATAAGQAREKAAQTARSEEHTSELQSLMRISYAVFCLKTKNKNQRTTK